MFVGSGTALTLALAASVAAAGISYYNSEQTEKQEDQTTANEINQQTSLYKQANQATQSLLAKDASNNTDKPQQSQLLSSFQNALKANASGATGGLNQVGNLSSAYVKAAQNASLGVSNYANTQATDLANMSAPALQRQGENASLSQYGSTIGGIQQQSASDQGLTNVEMAGIHSNPWLGALSSGLNAYASSSGSSGSLLGGMLTAGSSAMQPYQNPYATGNYTNAINQGAMGVTSANSLF